MGLATVVLLFVTVLIGAIVLAEFASPGRMRAVRGAARLVTTHLLLALAALVVWIAYLLDQTAGVAWAGLVVVGAVAGAGLFLWRRSLAPVADVDPGALRPVSSGLLVAHGAAAAVTIAFALLAAIGAGR